MTPRSKSLKTLPRAREKREIGRRLRRRTLLVRGRLRGAAKGSGLQRLPGWDQGGGEDEALMITPARSGARPRGPLRQARASAAACAGCGRSSTPCARKARAPWRPPGAIARAPSACCRTASRSSGRVMSPPPEASNFPQQNRVLELMRIKLGRSPEWQRGRPDCDALACRSIHSRQAEVRGRRPNASATTGRDSCAPTATCSGAATVKRGAPGA